MARVMEMARDDPARYCEWLQRTTAGMLATAPTGPGIRPPQLRHMSDYRTVDRTTLAPVSATPTPTPIEEVKAATRRVREHWREQVQDQAGEQVRRRVRNQIAADVRAAMETPLPEPYTLALGAPVAPAADDEPADYYSSPTWAPEPYTLALKNRQEDQR
jgi:hypothetical protein